ncbi:CUE domain-containing protein 1 isoform X2 [Hydra vulgaris]|uniref:CUE domain-containing protein 1 isoform X2 n=1 Tax=Hydra vulgaris TaxID=6087 RepID=A0ABM4CP62_HYDVU
MDSSNLSFHHNNSNRRRPHVLQTIPKPLNFDRAMSDFKTMFPEIDCEVIETVLRANDGAVQCTIDQLLVLQESAIKQTSNYSFNLPYLPSYEASEKKLDELPPAYKDIGEKLTSDFSVYNLNKIFNDSAQKFSGNKKSSWNETLIGKLPDDFLRLRTTNCYSNENDNAPLNSKAKNVCKINDDFMSEDELERFLEDEKLAMFLQNEEFIRELRRNKDFLTSLEADNKIAVGGTNTVISSPTVTSGGARSRTVYDDAVFRQKLKHMGKTTKKQFSKMAKKFSRGKTEVGGLIGNSESTINLLENDDTEKKDFVFDGIEENEELTDKDTALNVSSTSAQSNKKRHLPAVPQVKNVLSNSPKLHGNEEPIVFYSEDNEFSYIPENP